MKITIDPEFRSLIPPLSKDERGQLESNLRRDGVREPLTCWQYNGDLVLLDGHNRYEICQQHALPYEITRVEISGRDDAKVWIIDNQWGRRNLSDGWKVELKNARRAILAKQGRSNQAHGQTAPGKTLLSNNDKSVNTQAALASELGWSTGKLASADKVRADAPDLWEKVKDNTLSVGGAYIELKKRKREEKKKQRELEIKAQAEEIKEVAPVEQRFHVIVIDPPWPYGTNYDPSGRRAANPYPEMSLDEIAAIDIPAADDCVMWLWTTHKFLRHSFALLDGWGFRDVAVLTWVKDRIGLGSWLRSQSEFCIMAVKGSPVVNLTNQSTVISGPLREHSRKPDEFYEMVDALCVGAKIDYFSRESREGWFQYGNDVTKFVAKES